MNASVAEPGHEGGDPQTPATGVRLHCLGGGAAPPDLGADLLRLLRLPGEAQEKLWQVLVPCLAETLTKETEQLLDVFCGAYKVEEDDLAQAVKACRFVIRGAARLDLPEAGLAADLDQLCPADPRVKEIVLAGYAPAKEQLRREILRAAVADHGKLLTGVNLRLDMIQTSERGARLQLPVAVLTLHFQEGAAAGRVTFQVLPDMMAELRNSFEQVLG
jgi:hypothetical protein